MSDLDTARDEALSRIGAATDLAAVEKAAKASAAPVQAAA